MGKISPAYITARTARQFDTYLGGVAADARHTFKAWIKPVLKRYGLDLVTFRNDDGRHGWTVWRGNFAIFSEGSANDIFPEMREPSMAWLVDVLSAKVIGTDITFGCFMPNYFHDIKEDASSK